MIFHRLASADARLINSLNSAFVVDYKVALTLRQLLPVSSLQAKLDAGNSLHLRLSVAQILFSFFQSFIHEESFRILNVMQKVL